MGRRHCDVPELSAAFRRWTISSESSSNFWNSPLTVRLFSHHLVLQRELEVQHARRRVRESSLAQAAQARM
jgi:hypothetical protein